MDVDALIVLKIETNRRHGIFFYFKLKIYSIQYGLFNNFKFGHVSQTSDVNKAYGEFHFHFILQDKIN
jgi:hypothetical protein